MEAPTRPVERSFEKEEEEDCCCSTAEALPENHHVERQGEYHPLIKLFFLSVHHEYHNRKAGFAPSQEPGDSPSRAVRQWMAVIAAALAQFLFSGANSALFLGFAHSFEGCWTI